MLNLPARRGAEMKITDTKIPGVHIIETTALIDERGSFVRNFCTRDLAPVLQGRTIAQINQSKTAKVGSLRGMHFQCPPHAEIKLVRCLRGRIWDVALDLRRESPTFLQWHAEELTPGNMKMMIVPERCAHGFQVLEPDSEVLYLHTEFYQPAAEGAVHYNDPRINIKWPLAVTDLSPRDAGHAFLDDSFTGI